MNVRIAIADDIEAICRLGYQINQQHHRHVPHVFSNPAQSDSGSAFWLELMAADNTIFYVSEVESRISGFIVARLTQNTELSFLNSTRICRVNTIVVDEECQGCGIGNALMTAVERWAVANQADEMRLEVMEFNHQAQQFYDRQGFGTQSRIMSKWLKH
ncbi:GNAT family N-acetyltransferase [Photobacterium sp. TY1-4]|uniref:GNAT family N-acetyltransferase n=1 Tax=Photobacterium sp. TY1-4 TaxID=2899122 RepID=UPI0021C0FA21|nr:GNAT family N-acetyltransferase [Photobacterium sp. TY1-4]UXI02614.1 GNAT family N-acetyltransferase [Photobacterium sp. TY1-4]